jgi:hypothetical protein
LRRTHGGLEARFVNYTHTAAPLRVATEGLWFVTDLTGAVLTDPVDPWAFEVPAGGIVTLRRKA